MVRIHPGSFGRGMRIRNAALMNRLLVPIIRIPNVAVRIHKGSWSNGKTPVRQTGNPGSIPGGSIDMVQDGLPIRPTTTFTEGSRIRLAGPVC